MSKKILIVDDEEALTNILGEYFQKEKGFSIFTADDGEKAEQLIKKEKPDLVLLDMKLPKVDGIEVLKLLRQDYPETKVIVMTCYDVEYKKQMDTIGYDYFFTKPLSISDLESKVNKLMGIGVPTSKKESVLSGKDDAILAARLMVIEPRKNIVDLLKNFFETEPLSGGRYIVSDTHIYDIEEIKQFKPDIVLYDIIQIGTFSDVASELMKLENPPRDIILFGDPSYKWEEVDVLIERGMKYIQTPLKASDKFSDPEFELPSKETVKRLCEAVKETCLKHGLYRKK